MKRGRWYATAALAFACAAAAAAPAGASTRNYLTIQGQVLDHTRSPLPAAWVFCIGSRRASAQVDTGGTYQLEIPGATLEELNRTPLKIRISARKKGWRFALANGAPELGLEMRVVQEDGKLPRLLIRSNDPDAVSSVANSAVLDANPRALIDLTFIGSQGAQYDTPAVPLDISDEVTLAGSVASVPEIPGGAPHGPPEIESEPDSVPAAAPTTPPAAAPSTPAPSAAALGATAAPPPAANAAKPSTQSGSQSSHNSQSSHKKWNAAGTGKSDSKPKVYHPGDAPSAAAAPSSQAAAPPAGTPAATPGAPTSASPQSATPQGAQHVTPSAQDPSLKPVLQRDAPVSGVAPAPPPPAAAVGVAKSGTAQPVPSRAPATPSAASGPPSAAASTCDCTIRGTVEVNSDRPLTSRTEVVISIDDAPETTASVELFMGSPRAFEIHPAPCGVHRLLLWTRARQRFVLVSAEPRVVCTEGGTQQMRLVLEPVARWGAGR